MGNLERTIEEEAQRVKPMVCAKVNREDVEDVMQDIRLSFLTAFPRFRRESKLSTYAHIIAKRRIADYFRKKYKGKHCPLTKSEMKVFMLVGEGMDNEEIAKVLGLTRHTVRAYISWIYRKLQIPGDRAKLALLSYRFFKEQSNEN